jgi:hypothetical protein
MGADINARTNTGGSSLTCTVLANRLTLAEKTAAAAALLVQQPGLVLCDAMLEPCLRAWQLAVSHGEAACMAPLLASTHWRALERFKQQICISNLLVVAPDLAAINALASLPGLDMDPLSETLQ